MEVEYGTQESQLILRKREENFFSYVIIRVEINSGDGPQDLFN